MIGIPLQETRVYQTAKEEGAQSLASLLLQQKLGELSPAFNNHLLQLNATQLEALAIALLHFESVADLERWWTENG